MREKFDNLPLHEKARIVVECGKFIMSGDEGMLHGHLYTVRSDVYTGLIEARHQLLDLNTNKFTELEFVIPTAKDLEKYIRWITLNKELFTTNNISYGSNN